MTLRELTTDEFARFTNVFPLYSIYQTPEYAFVMNHQNFDSMFLGMIDAENHIVAASLILIEKFAHFKYAYAPRGFLIDYNNASLLKIFTELVKQYLGKRSVMAMKISPQIIRSTYDPKYQIQNKNNYYDRIFATLETLDYRHLGYNHYFEALKPRFEAIIELNLPYYLLFKNIKKEYRTKIRNAERNGIKIYKGKKEDLNLLYFQTKTKYPRDLRYFEDLYEFFSKRDRIDFFYAKLDTAEYLKRSQSAYVEQEEILVELNNNIISAKGNAKKKAINKKMMADRMASKLKEQMVYATKLLRDAPDGVVLASVLIIHNQDTAFMIMDGYNTSYKNLNGKHLLLWKLMERYNKLGFKKINLNGITDVTLESNPYHGLNQFKLNFHALAIEYMGDLELVTNNTLYFMYKNAGPIRSVLKK